MAAAHRAAARAGLVRFVADGGNAFEELAHTYAVPGTVSDNPLTFFRPPYGNWREEMLRLHRSPMSSIAANSRNAASDK